MEPTQADTKTNGPFQTQKTLDFLRFVQDGLVAGEPSGRAYLPSSSQPLNRYASEGSIDDPQLRVFRMLARFNVEYNYLEYVLPLQAKGKQPREEGKEDHWLVAALIAETNDAKQLSASDYVYSRPAYKEEGGCLELEARLIKLAEHYDGAIVIDRDEILPYLKFDGAIRDIISMFNWRYGHDMRYYDDIEHPKLLPSSFTVGSGGKTQTGSRTSTFTAIAQILKYRVKSHVMKTTTFGGTGVGKVLTMFTNPSRNTIYLYEFFLYLQDDISTLIHKPENPLTARMYFNPAQKVVGIVRHYQTDLDPNIRHPLKLVLESIANGNPLQSRLREQLHGMLHGFDPDAYYETPPRTVLEECRIDATVKEGLRWILFEKLPDEKLRDAAKRILGQEVDQKGHNLRPAYTLTPEDRLIRDSFERVLKGALIKPKLIFARYISPHEIGVRQDIIDAKMAEFQSLKRRHKTSAT